MYRPSSRNIIDLQPILREDAIKVIEGCRAQKINLIVYCTYRSLDDQARAYRCSRRTAEIEAKITEYNTAGYYVLANALRRVGPQPGVNGLHITHAGPGESFHQYGEAFDAVPVINGKAVWDNPTIYGIYGEICRDVGLEWGGDWQFKDLPHAQIKHGVTNPLAVYTPDEVEASFTITDKGE